MSKELFTEKNFATTSRTIISQANQIIDDYLAQGFTLTLRQLYYQFVARGLLPNKQTEYKRLGSIINDGRLAGLIDWEAIEDRTRNLQDVAKWAGPADIVDACASQYKEDLWIGQTQRPEVWIEKEALVGVIEPACLRYRVPYFACRGYSSQSEQYRAGKRFARWRRNGQTPVVLHLGDHDPSGVDMTRDNRDRLALFARHGVLVNRLALNMDQIEQYNPPPNPAKESDTRSPDYIDQFGESSWELDALDPPVIDRLIADALDAMINRRLWDSAKNREDDNKQLLQKVADRWSDVQDFLNNDD